MADKRVSIQIDGKVVVDDSDLKRARREMEETIGGRSAPTGDPARTIGSGGDPDNTGSAVGEAIDSAGEAATDAQDAARDSLDRVRRSVEAQRQAVEASERAMDTQRARLEEATRRASAPDMRLHTDIGQQALEGGDLQEASRRLVMAMRENEPSKLVGTLRADLLKARRQGYEPPEEDTQLGVTSQYAEGQTRRSLLSLQRGMAQASSEADVDRLLNRARGTRVYAEASENEELQEQLDELVEALERSRRELSDNTRQLERSGGDEDRPIDVAWRSLGEDGANQLGGTIAQALGGGAFGGNMARMLSGLLSNPAVIAAGVATAAVGAFNWTANRLQQGNTAGRQDVQGFGDLARQYGSDRNFLTVFRDPDRGYRTRDPFARYGYSAVEAGAVAAAYDRPWGDPDDMASDVSAILRFSRGTGLDERAVAAAAQAFSIGSGGSPADQLRTLRVAIAEGFEEGVASSVVMQTLVDYSRQSAAAGQALRDEGLAARAGRQGIMMARYGSSSLRGAMGSNALNQIEGTLFDRGTDEGLAFYVERQLMSAMQGGTLALEDTGFTGNELAGLRQVFERDPLMAARLVRQNARNSPRALEIAGDAMQRLTGGDPFLTALLSQDMFDLSAQQAAAMAGTPYAFSTLFGNAGRVEGVSASTDLSDPQSWNRALMNTEQLEVTRSDQMVVRSLGNLVLTGDLEIGMADIRARAAAFYTDTVSGLMGDPLRGERGQSGASLRRDSMVGGLDGYQGDFVQVGAGRPARGGLDAGTKARMIDELGYVGIHEAGFEAEAAIGQFIYGNRATAITNVPGSSGGHRGLDLFGSPTGENRLRSPVAGTIVDMGDLGEQGLGRYVIVQDAYTGARHTFGHLASFAQGLTTGTRVTPGMFIGVEGNTGYTEGPTGNHLHYQISDGRGSRFTPAEYYQRLMEEGGAPEWVRGAGFASGGFTGAGARMEPAGVVHRGEYVWSREATERYLPALQALQSGAASGGGATEVRIVHEHGGAIRVEGVPPAVQTQLDELYRRTDAEAARILTARDRDARPRYNRGGIR